MSGIKRLIKFSKDPLKRSIILNTLCKPLSMIVSFLYTPLLLNYLGNESFGIWTTMFSVINWINYFDVGIGNGLRNILSQYIDHNNKKDACIAVSTSYIVLSLISSLVLIVGIISIFILDIGNIFNTDLNIRPALLITFIFICINFILGLIKTQLYALNEAEKVGFMTINMQLLNLIGIFIISSFSKANLFYVAIIIGVSGALINIIYTKGIWIKYKFLIPRLNMFDIRKLKIICNIGIKLFLIQICAIILYSTDNIIISKLFGPAAVTPYSTAYTAFGLLNGIFGAMLVPLWSKYAVAIQRENYIWIKNTILKLLKLLPFIAILIIIGVFLYKPVAVVWLHKALNYDKGLILCTGVYYFMMIWGSIYSTALNGMSRVNLQLVLAIITAIVNIPLSVFLGKILNMGTTGIILATILCMLFTNIIVSIDIHGYLNKKINTSNHKIGFKRGEK